MPEGFLSQEEIDALLGKGDQKDDHSGENSGVEPDPHVSVEEETPKLKKPYRKFAGFFRERLLNWKASSKIPWISLLAKNLLPKGKL